MEQLSTSDQEKVWKMSSDRLRASLLQAEYVEEEEVLKMSREQLMDSYAEYVEDQSKGGGDTSIEQGEIAARELALREQELAIRRITLVLQL